MSGEKSNTPAVENSDLEYGKSPVYSLRDGPVISVSESSNVPTPVIAPIPDNLPETATTKKPVHLKPPPPKAKGQFNSKDNPFEPEDSREGAYQGTSFTAPPRKMKKIDENQVRRWSTDEERRLSSIEDNIVVVDVAPEDPDGKVQRTRSQTCQLWYPLVYALITTTYAAIALVPKWKKFEEKKYHVVLPLMLVAAAAAAILTFATLFHTFVLVCGRKTRLGNKEKIKTDAKMALSSIALSVTLGIAALAAYCFYVVLNNLEQFHKVVELTASIVWWVSFILSTPCLAWLILRSFLDTTRICFRPEKVQPEPEVIKNEFK